MVMGIFRPASCLQAAGTPAWGPKWCVCAIISETLYVTCWRKGKAVLQDQRFNALTHYWPKFCKMGSIDCFCYYSHQSILARTIDANAPPLCFPRSTSGTTEIKLLSARPHSAPGKDMGDRGVSFPQASHRLCPSWWRHWQQDPCGLPGPCQGQQHPEDFDDWFYSLEHTLA